METPSRMSTEQGVIILQYVARALFAVLAVIYFNHSDGFFFALPAVTPWVLAGSYLGLQLLFLLARVPHATLLASGLDVVILGVVILIDAGQPPPTMALLFLAVLSNGLLYGLRRFLIMLAAAEVVLAIVMPIRLGYGDDSGALLNPAASASLFLLAALTVCMLYFGLMIWRNQVLARQSVENAWRDPQTGFISRAALSSTAGWLIPLHDRLSSPLTLVLVHDDDLNALADAVAQRLRRSDIVARYDEEHLALLLPCTATGAAEQLLADLRGSRPGLRAALLTLHSANAALEQVLHHLQTAMPRTRPDDGHWLAHATPLA
ncbi:GGDEF domain-containing protein [Alloalcanivorax sp. C16-2]|uniref:GGDEF domain-containing protein n=1 Tax=Alloalcanivorax TaxID=3020832 RepID=UPI0019340810|nr:GGDEF domain-containing protein [Alloalcanivorax marinus]MBL7251640.1 GGDEF domain-containing protein [Alloalcanivorax marinus]